MDEVHQGAELFLITKQLLSKVEQQVIRIETKYSWLNFILNYSFFPIMFLTFGVSELFKPLKTWGALFFISIIVVLGVFLIIYFPEEQKSNVVSFCFYGPIILVMYAIPSSYAFDSILPEEITYIKRFLNQQDVETETKIKLLTDNVGLVKARVYARVNFFKWLLGVSWALSLLLLNQYNSLAIRLEPGMVQETIGTSLETLLVGVFIALFILCSIISYKKANDAVFSRIEFALSELQYSIEMNKTTINASDKFLDSRKLTFSNRYRESKQD